MKPQCRRPKEHFLPIIAAMMTMLIVVSPVHAQTVTEILHQFAGPDGLWPIGNVIEDTAGNIYGVTSVGGAYASNPKFSCGTVFELSPTASGGWKETVLHKFIGLPTDGCEPSGGLALDTEGNLYGVTIYGGAYGTGNTQGYGTVFELSPTAGGGWTEAVIYNFRGEDGPDGFYPIGNLVVDVDGDLFGVTATGGNVDPGEDVGTVYELSPLASGWQETILHSFGEDSQRQAAGWSPSGGVIFDAAGNLYGATGSGGSSNQCCGVTYQLSLGSSGTWTETVLFTFSGSDGASPTGRLAIDSGGNLYGATNFGGHVKSCNGKGCGVIYELSPNVSGTWTQNVLHAFTSPPGRSYGAGGSQPSGGVTLDSFGNLFGSTVFGGNSAGDGVVFRLSLNPSQIWEEEVLHRFHHKRDGNSPQEVSLDGAGDVLGMAQLGGMLSRHCSGYSGCGTVFAIRP
ncbi:MAG: choice-of-anchor tandem repeat GloVer-containing protein [Terriglobales bacterium]